MLRMSKERSSRCRSFPKKEKSAVGLWHRGRHSDRHLRLGNSVGHTERSVHISPTKESFSNVGMAHSSKGVLVWSKSAVTMDNSLRHSRLRVINEKNSVRKTTEDLKTRRDGELTTISFQAASSLAGFVPLISSDLQATPPRRSAPDGRGQALSTS